MTNSEQFVAMQVSSETRRAYEQDMRRWLTFAEGKELNFELILAFRDHLANTLAPASAVRNWSSIRAYHRWLVSLGLQATNLFDSIKAPKRIANQTPVVPTDDEVAAVVAAADNADTKYAAVIALLLNGLRAGEIGELRMRDVGIETKDGYAMRVVGKGQKERLIPMTDEAWAAVRRFRFSSDHVEVKLGQGGDVFAIPNQYGEKLTNKAVAHMVEDVCRWAGVKGVHPHSFRHHYATRLVKAGVDLQHVRDLLGHTSVATTQIYVTLDLSDLFMASRLDPRNPKSDGLRVVREEIA